MCERSMKVDDLFIFYFLVFNSNWAVFVKLKLKPPFKNPESANAGVASS